MLRKFPALVAFGLLALGLWMPWPAAILVALPALILVRRWPGTLWLLVVPLAGLLQLAVSRHEHRQVQQYAGASGVFLYEVRGRGLGVLRQWVRGQDTLDLFLPVGLLSFGRYTFGERLWLEGTLLSRDSVPSTLQAFYRGEGRALVLRPRELLGREWPSGPAATLRRHIRQHLQKHLPEPEASLAVALVLGDRQGLPRRVLQDFRQTGTLHLLALSGLHVGLLLLILLLFLRTLRVPFRAALFGATALLWIYLGIVGPRPSLVRGLIFVSAFALAYLVERPRNYLNFLGVAGFASLLVAPWWVWSVGFHLSYGATLGILVGMPAWPKLRWPHLQPLWDALGVSLFAQGALVPLLLFYFHGLSVLAPLLNVPLVFLTWLLMAELFLGILAGPWGGAFLRVADLLARVLLGTVHQAARWPWGYLQVADFPAWALGLGILGVLSVFLLWRRLLAAPFQGTGTGPKPRNDR